MDLGGTSLTVLLAEARVASLPAGPLAWAAYEATLAAGRTVTHRHVPSFVFAGEPLRVTVNAATTALRSGQAVFVGENVAHTHVGPGRFWEIRLAAPGGQPPADLGPAPRRVFASPALETVPPPPVLVSFVLVALPPGGETAVHTHPGPEFIYVTRGELVYQNALIGTRTMRVGDAHALRMDTAVQKRNATGAEAEFLSLFILDPARPPVSPARF